MLDSQANQRFVATKDSDFDPERDGITSEGHDTTSCTEFADVIAKWNEVQNLRAEEIRHLLENLFTSDGENYWDIIEHLGETYGFLEKMGKFTELINLPSIPTDKIDAALTISELGVDLLIKREEERVGAAFLITRLGRLEGLQGALWALGVVKVPFDMWTAFTEEQLKTAKTWEILGARVAVRQWLRALYTLTKQRENDFPDNLEINVSTPAGHHLQGPYYERRFFKELEDEYGYTSTGFSNVFYDGESVKKGFDAGVKLMEKIGKEILHVAEEEVGDVLQASGLEPCKINILTDAGMLDFRRLRTLFAREITKALLDKLPTVPP
jgi:hypothetical protein